MELKKQEISEEYMLCGINCVTYVNNNIKSCIDVCPEEYYVKNILKGICEHVSCEEDNISPKEESCDYDCLYDESDTLCHKRCSNEYHYEKKNQKCVTKSCSSRTSNSSVSSTNNPCGPGNCYKDKDRNNNENCVERYTNPNHYSPSSTGLCDEKECTSRISNGSTKNPCGNAPCCLDGNADYGCVISCTHSNLYEPNNNGICVLKNCISRTANDTESNFGCGYSYNDDCVLDINSMCQLRCSKPNHYEAINGKC
jgi:hypothetical protein